MISVGCLFSRWELAMQAGDQPCSRAPLCSYRSETQMLLPSLGMPNLKLRSILTTVLTVLGLYSEPGISISLSLYLQQWWSFVSAYKHGYVGNSSTKQSQASCVEPFGWPGLNVLPLIYQTTIFLCFRYQGKAFCAGSGELSFMSCPHLVL
jgi:hypothetical protein